MRFKIDNGDVIRTKGNACKRFTGIVPVARAMSSAAGFDVATALCAMVALLDRFECAAVDGEQRIDITDIHFTNNHGAMQHALWAGLTPVPDGLDVLKLAERLYEQDSARTIVAVVQTDWDGETPIPAAILKAAEKINAVRLPESNPSPQAKGRRQKK